jgi:hypothetical protein
MDGTLLLETVRLADRRVEVDREGCRPGTGSCPPGPGEEMPADGVELADVAPAEAAQERAQGRCRLDPEAEDPVRAAGPRRGRVIDAVTARERGHHERHELVTRVGSTGLLPEIEVGLDEIVEAQMLSQRGRQQEAGIGHELRPVERGVNPVEAVGRSHPAGAPLLRVEGCVATPSFPIRRAPVVLSRIVNLRPGSVDSGLDAIPIT